MNRRRWRFMQSSLYEYFYYFLALSLLVAFTSGGALYYSSSKILWKDAIQSNSNTLQLLKNGQEIVLSEVDKAMEAVFLDSTFMNYMEYQNSSDILMQLRIQQRLDSVVLATDYIHSVYIYYTGPKFVLSSTYGALPLDQFNDRAFAESLVGQSIDKSFDRTRALPGISSVRDETVITIVKTLPIIHSGTPAAYVVMNIKSDYLIKIMDSLNTNKDAQLVVTDRDGHILSQKTSADSPSIGNLPGEFNISLLKGISGSIFATVQNTKSLICYVQSESSGWKYIYTMPKSAITKSLNVWSKVTVMICTLAILLSLLGSLLLSRRIFNPLNRLLYLLRGASRDEVRSVADNSKEMAQIEHNVNRLIVHNQDLTLLLKDYEKQSRNKFLLRLAGGAETDSSRTQERLEYYGVELDPVGNFIIVIVSLDDFTKFSQEAHESQRNELLVKVTEQIQTEAFVERTYWGYLVEAESNEMVLVLNSRHAGDEFESIRAELYTWLRELHEKLQAESKMTVTLGVSSVHRGLNELGECYSEADSAVGQKLIYGYNNIIFYEERQAESAIALYPLKIEKQLLTFFKTGNREGVTQSLLAFESHMVEHHSKQLEVVRQYFLQLFSSSLRCIYEIDANLGFQSSIQQLSYTDLIELETMQSMVKYMQVLYDLILDQLDQKRSMKNKELVTSVTAYVDENLGADLSIERLSELFAISTSHLRKIYKEETGLTLKETISGKRIEKAKKLLSEQNLKVQDIALQVGYLTVQSFAKAFKMETGKTPGEYRDQALRGNGMGIWKI
ncbi:helix-turn-helix domain-containing protein [Paenibacillus glycanilyticus]|nr:helix-turn-helix domain-containing protein [Paenibacillus glycanilyticus]